MWYGVVTPEKAGTRGNSGTVCKMYNTLYKLNLERCMYAKKTLSMINPKNEYSINF